MGLQVVQDYAYARHTSATVCEGFKACAIKGVGALWVSLAMGKGGGGGAILKPPKT